MGVPRALDGLHVCSYDAPCSVVTKRETSNAPVMLVSGEKAADPEPTRHAAAAFRRRFELFFSTRHAAGDVHANIDRPRDAWTGSNPNFGSKRPASYRVLDDPAADRPRL